MPILQNYAFLSILPPFRRFNLNLSKNIIPRNQKIFRFSPNYEEGLYIQYLLKKQKNTFVNIGFNLGVSHQIVFNVVYGKRRSARIESEIARILGKASWNDVVLEARSEVQKKPVNVILREMEKEKQAAIKESEMRMAEYFTQNRKRVDRIIREGFASKKRRGA